MAHLVNTERTYRLLQQRLDRNVTGAPESPVFTQILRLLFTPEEADLARQLPTQFTPLGHLARRLEVEPAALDTMLTEMAHKGLVADVEHEGQRYFSLAPVVIGFLDFTFMRAPDGLPLAELARLFDDYMFQSERSARAIFCGETQIGRSLVRKEALPQDDYVEILGWERASHIVETATAHAVSLCACRHHHSHLVRLHPRPLWLWRLRISRDQFTKAALTAASPVGQGDIDPWLVGLAGAAGPLRPGDAR